MNILDKIVFHKRGELISRKNKISLDEIKRKLDIPGSKKSFREALLKPGNSRIIAEFKRESPSKGPIHRQANLEEIVRGYVNSGASCLSVLTESTFFKGSDEDFIKARKISPIPMIRKDFMIDPYQFYEAKMMGADAVLLIASILSPVEVKDFTHLAHSLEMEVLLEVHSLEELEKTYVPEIDLVGVNNRDLTNFKVDVNTSLKLIEKIPDQSLKISESGISDPELVIQLIQAGFHGFLIGETFMKEKDPGSSLHHFIARLQKPIIS